MCATIPFPKTLDIPELDFLAFTACNNAPKGWIQKPTFYLLKNDMLQDYGTYDGYDLQIIQRKCHSCDGKGNYWTGEACYRCRAGIYETMLVALKRYVLNDVLFHRPVGRVDARGHLDGAQMQFRTTIHGLVTHTPADGYNADNCLDFLLCRYAPDKMRHKLTAEDLPF